MNQQDATVASLRILADAIESGKVEFVRSDLVREAEMVVVGVAFPLPRRLSLFVEVSH